MTVPLEPDTSISPRLQFGTELRKFRLSQGVTQRRLCETIHLSISHLSMIENGHRGPTPDLARRMDDALNLGSTLTGLLDRLNRAAAQLPPWFRPWLEYEQEAEALRVWEPLMVPGLMQTEDYARAILSRRPGVTPEQAEERVAARMERQKILHRSIPPLLWVIIDEGVLNRPIADPEIMKAQFEYLLEMGGNSHVSLHVLPHKARSVLGLLGGFAIADMPKGASPAAYIASQSTEDPVSVQSDEVSFLSMRYDLIRVDALARHESSDMIKEKIRKWTG
ncbi:helix-turn-helix transcriptional regulator [Sphaerisporangium rubeum]|uniref:Transcriptional regulator with XRE-family HTH domain n=1 Tax=Sphaerisporangium rubeum TaxID=321317 RepID=A0A7X0IJM5_9ACTN|nr:helix-turn-helix transcriptional regulator [Sphaerisporangium rubeum]MBB6476386.1 transcriptional regulator with XRE-family HTH domain [Sphaerisporangium rubeum]